MRDSGYQFADQDDARLAFLEAEDVTAEELEVREQDLDCDLQTRLTVTRSVWERHRFDAWIDANAAAIQALAAEAAAATTALAELELEALNR